MDIADVLIRLAGATLALWAIAAFVRLVIDIVTPIVPRDRGRTQGSRR